MGKAAATSARIESTIVDLIARKRELDKTPPPRKPRVKTAAERTVPLFDASDMGEQANFAQPLVQPGPPVERCQVKDSWCTHLRRESGAKSLCGGVLDRRSQVSGRICEVCRIEASKLRAVIK